jgi:lysophospholipase L1-like esterase
MKFFLKTLTLFAFCLPFLSCAKDVTNIPADHPMIQYYGRIDFSNPQKPRFAYSGVSINAKFTGTSLGIRLNNYSDADQNGNLLYNFYNVFVDGKLEVIKVENGKHEFFPGRNLKDTVHTVLIFRRTEAFCGIGEFEGFIVDKGKELVKILPSAKPRAIEFIGNSITCGYGNEGDDKSCPFSPETENNYQAYGAITARNLGARYSAICFSGKGVIRNYDKSFTEPMPELYNGILPQEPSLKWDFSKQIPDVVVINLGTNDFAHENPDSTAFVTAYSNLLKKIRSNYRNARIFCITGPMINDAWPAGSNAKATCTRFIKAAIKSRGDEKVFFFEMKSQGANGYGCDWHPNLRQHEINAAELTAFIRKEMGW